MSSSEVLNENGGGDDGDPDDDDNNNNDNNDHPDFDQLEASLRKFLLEKDPFPNYCLLRIIYLISY